MIKYIYLMLNQTMPEWLPGFAYNFFYIIACITFAILILFHFIRYGISLKNTIFTVVILTVTYIILADIGVRIAGIFYLSPEFYNPFFMLKVFVAKPSKTYHAAILLIIIWSFIYCRLMFDKNWRMPFDSLALYLPIVHAIGRLSCLSFGCCWGDELGICLPGTDIPFKNPIPLYESIFCIVIFAVLLFVFKKIHPRPAKGASMDENEKLLSAAQVSFAGIILPIYMVLYGLWRFVIEFFRTNPKLLFSLTQAQIVMILFVLIGGIIITIKFYRYKGSNLKFLG